jgi:hypothetical protein
MYLFSSRAWSVKSGIWSQRQKTPFPHSALHTSKPVRITATAVFYAKTNPAAGGGGDYVMQLSPQQAEKLLRGNYTFSLWSLSMLITRLKGVYAKDSEALDTCTGELNAFVRKFGKIMGNDYVLLEKL